MAPESLADRALERVRAEMARKNLNQTDIAGILQWTQSRVSKILNRRIALTVDDLSALCFALGLHVTEAVRDHGLEFLAEMTPSELRLLERIRQLPKPIMDSISLLLDVASKTRMQERKAKPSKKGSMPTLSNLR